MEAPVICVDRHDTMDEMQGIPQGIFPGGLEEVTPAFEPGIHHIRGEAGREEGEKPFFTGLEIVFETVVVVFYVVGPKQGAEGEIDGDIEDEKKIGLEGPVLYAPEIVFPPPEMGQHEKKIE